MHELNGIKVWIVGVSIDDADGWELHGVFASKKEGIKACHTEEHFIGSIIVGEEAPKESVEWKGCYYPLVEKDPDEREAASKKKDIKIG